MYFKYKECIRLTIKILKPIFPSIFVGSNKSIKTLFDSLNKFIEKTAKGDYQLPELPEESFGPTKFIGEDKDDF